MVVDKAEGQQEESGDSGNGTEDSYNLSDGQGKIAASGEFDNLIFETFNSFSRISADQTASW